VTHSGVVQSLLPGLHLAHAEWHALSSEELSALHGA